jgi:hypothetical protein
MQLPFWQFGLGVVSNALGTKTRKRICEPAINGGKDCPAKKVI